MHPFEQARSKGEYQNDKLITYNKTYLDPFSIQRYTSAIVIVYCYRVNVYVQVGMRQNYQIRQFGLTSITVLNLPVSKGANVYMKLTTIISTWNESTAHSKNLRDIPILNVHGG